MRIGIDAWGLSGSIAHTGVGQYTRHLISHLAAIDADAQLIAYGAPREPRPAWLPPAVNWRDSGVLAPGRWRAFVSRTLSIRRQVAADGIDVFHTPGVHARASLPPVAWVTCPLVVTIHDLIPLTFYADALSARMRVFYRWNLRRALSSAAVITVSDAAKSEILAHAPQAASNLYVIPNGVEFASSSDIEPLARLGIQQPYILYAGSYEPRKNIETAFRAYGQLLNAGLSHRLVAIVEAQSGHARTVVERLAALSLGDHTRLVSGLDDAEIRALYTHASALCFPSLAEGFGFPPLQAAACGVPVVAADLPSTRETMGDHVLYVDSRDAHALAGALSRVLQDDDLRDRLIAGARTRPPMYSWERSARAHFQLYGAVARSRHQAPAKLESAN